MQLQKIKEFSGGNTKPFKQQFNFNSWGVHSSRSNFLNYYNIYFYEFKIICSLEKIKKSSDSTTRQK